MHERLVCVELAFEARHQVSSASRRLSASALVSEVRP
jgi:hypothetical protein